jgi:hypothetical protein
MSERRKKTQGTTATRTWVWAVIVVALVGGLVAGLLASKPKPASMPTVATPVSPQPQPTTPPSATPSPTVKLETLEVAQAVMVTVELNFGPEIPTIEEALRDIERRYAPDDGVGRTFAILDAYGDPTRDGKLHISMHVSSEKTGLGSLVFKRTGEVLWQGRIVQAAKPPSSAFAGKNLTIMVDNGAGKSLLVDGSTNPSSILEARVKDAGVPVSALWPDGAEREVTFIYSACGCPVKVMCKRQGDTTVRTRPLPVIFPDDPAAVAVIKRLMRW